GFDLLVDGAALAANAIRGLQVVWQGLKVVANAVTLALTEALEWTLRGIDQLAGGVNTLLNFAIKGINAFSEGAIQGINFLIEQINKIPGIEDIPLLDPKGLQIPELDTSPLSGIIETVDGITQSLKHQTEVAAKELHDLMMQGLPGDEIKRRIDEIYSRVGGGAADGGESGSEGEGEG